jgi:hypothetical protein
MGVVYMAHDGQLNRIVALKSMRGAYVSGGEEIERFYREAQAAAKLEHRHVVQIHDVGEIDGEAYYTMAFVPGTNLAARMAEGAIEPTAAVRLVEKLARALHYAHQMGVIHRDLKPSNVLLDEEGEPRISDFGLAKIIGEDRDLTRIGQVLGTPAYMAPEQAQGQGSQATARSDIWSLGVILYELFTGKRPFGGRFSEEITRNVLRSEPTPPHVLQAKLDPALEIIILKCLKKNPERRHESAAALADELERWLRGAAPRPPWWMGTGRRLRRRRRLAVACLVALLAGAIALGIVGAARKSSSREPIDLLAQPDILAADRLLLGEGALTPVGDGAALHLKAKELALVQLMARPPWERYRFRVKLRDLGTTRDLGIYVLGQRQLTSHGEEYWFCEITFTEQEMFLQVQGKLTNKAQALMRLRRHVRLEDGIRDDRTEDTFPPTNFPGKLQSLRTLAIEVTPDVVTAYWDNTQFPWASVARVPRLIELPKALAEQGRFQNPNPPAPAMRGSLGLILERGTAICEEATLEPLPD